MKEAYNDLRCPHCGAKDFRIVTDDVFYCEYCKQKFKYNIDDLSLTEENTVLIEELKETFYDKIVELNKQKRLSYACLLYYKKRANPRKMLVTFGIILGLSSFILFAALITYQGEFWSLIIPAIAIGLSLPLYIFAKIRNKKRAQKYEPYVRCCASDVADCDNEINLYSRLISRLTK